MKLNYILASAILIGALGIAGCKKGDLGEPKYLAAGVPHVPNVLNMFKVKLTVNKSEPYAIGADGVINIGPKDSAIIDYTIESPDADMYQVALYKTGGGLPTQRIPVTEGMNRRVYSGRFKFYAQDLGSGSTTSYRIWANDANGVYLGDGGLKFTINVSSDMKYFTNKRLFLPDSSSGKENCYASLSTGELYSYTTGAVHSAAIDLGLFSKFERTGTFQVIDINGDGKLDTVYALTRYNYLYSLAANPLPFTGYDISSWAKRGTLFSKQVTGGSITDIVKKFSTAAKIETEAKKQTINLTMVPASADAAKALPLAAGQYIYFKTPEGKYGVILIQAIAGDYRFNTYLQLVWRIQN